MDARRSEDVWPYSRSLDAAPGPVCAIRNEAGVLAHGINYASQDYLSLASHPAIAEAAIQAIRDFGPHSAGSAMLLGNTKASLLLEQSLAEMVQMEHVMLFPTGWGAGYGTITGLVRKSDHIVMDQLAHACLQSGAYAATRNVRRFPHLDNEAVRAKLRNIRQVDNENGILVVTEGLFSMDADYPDLIELQAICHEFGATLLVDVAHDFGAMGPGGSGTIGAQGMLGKVDLVMGAFSKTFASNGGFLASNSGAVKQFVKMYGGPHIFSNALSPVQATIVRTAIEIIRSGEGHALRDRLKLAISALRSALSARGLECIGTNSPIVPVLVGQEKIARIAAAIAFQQEVFFNQVEFPAVPIGGARFRMQVMAAHTESHAQEAARVVAESIAMARQIADAE